MRAGGHLMAHVPAPVTPSELPAAEDFYRLRREGIGHIQQTGSEKWTDYNTHDPGISTLEALAYAITELAYRSGFPIEDILASAATGASPDDPYPHQTFYSARKILTVNPTTTEDFRRLLIDVDPVRNAWVRCKACACDAPFFAWCDDDQLVLSHDPSQRSDEATPAVRVDPRGLYDVLLELEADPNLGDLNDRKIIRRRTVTDADGRRHLVTIEMRFPAWGLARRDERRLLADNGQPFTLTVAGPNRTTTGTTPVDDAELRNHWFDVFYVDYEITLADTTKIPIENASVRLFSDGTVRSQATVADLLGWLGDATPEGFVEPYSRKMSLTGVAVDAARAVLETHRNLDEDYCHIELVEIDEIAVCADVEVEPSADIDLLQAQIWFEIERYLNPPVEFWSLDELLAGGVPVEAIFNGPELDNGFLTQQGLRDTDLRTEVRVSDILHRLIDIDGVVSVDNLMLTAYDASGNPIAGIADPDWSTGTPAFDPTRISASWLLNLPADHCPRLHHGLSRFLFSSNDLPFLPRLDESEDTLVQLQGQAARPKIRATELDLPMPIGRARALEAYYPVQHSFPLTYGIGPPGLPSTATAERRAQAKQLKAYLMVYEQLLHNAYAQVAHVGELFSLDPTIEHTYFSGLFSDPPIVGYDEIVAANLTEGELTRLVESPTEFLERRNRFLDHLLARFGESFGEYAMLLTDLEGQGKAREDLIRDKLRFLQAFPRVSHDRGKAFDHTIAPCDPDNTAGLQQRTNLLLGLPDWTLAYRAWKTAGAPGFGHGLSLDELGQPIVSFSLPPAVDVALAALLADRGLGASPAEWRIESTDGQLVLTTEAAGQTTEELLLTRYLGGAAAALGRELVAAQRAILQELVLRDRYGMVRSGNRWKVTVADGDGNRIGLSDQRFFTKRTAGGFIYLMTVWSAHKRAVVVEHLLLRPKFPGDALYPACTDGPCCECGDEDPYSFRLTYVMPGWTAPFSTNMGMRGFADRMVQEQTPSHLLPKICWVGNDGYVPDPCDPVVDAVASVLEPHTTNHDAACSCAAEIYAAYGTAFDAWLSEHTVIHDPPDAVAAALAAMFDADVDLTGVACAGEIDADVEHALEAVLVEHFVAIARAGYQFERFEDAWCAWADADAAIDWSEERLQDTMVEILTAGATTPGVDHETLCTCAATILATFGTHFREWIDGKIAAGTPLDELTDFDPPDPALCAGITFDEDVAGEIRDPVEAALRHVHAGVVSPARAGARPRRPAQHLPTSDPPRLRRGLRLQPRPARPDRTREQHMNPTDVTYPVFEANQVLTNAHLNELFEYLDEQTRLTRSNLIGIGIACGLEVTFEAPGTVHLSRGCGVTSQGYLIVEPADLDLAFVRSYTLPTEPGYPPLTEPGTDPAEQFDLWELFPDDDEPGAQSLATSGLVLEDKAFLLFLELRQDGLRNCSPNNCDDRGAEVTATVRRLLIDVTDLDAVIAATSGAAVIDFGADLTERLALPDLRMPRVDVPSSGPVAPEDVLFAFQATFRQNHLVAATADALSKLYGAFKPLVVDEYPANPFDSFYQSVRLPRRDPGDDRRGSLHAVLLGPVRRPARGLRRAALEGRRPDVCLLPARGPVPAPPDGGCARPEPPTTPPTTATRSCRRRAVGDCEDRTREVGLLFRRLVALLESFTETPPDEGVRATPSRWGDVAVSAKAIPFYYDQDGTPPVFELWNPTKTARNRANQNLSYRSDEYAPPPPPFVTDPLRFDLEPNNFLRIEGHVGKNVQSVLEALLSLQKSYRLPFEVVALRTGAFDENIDVDLSTEDCRFQDLETLYEALKAELICFLVKQVEYFYALPDEVVLGEGTAVPTLGLLKQYAPDFVAQPGTLGRKIERVLTWKPGQPLVFIFAIAGMPNLPAQAFALVGAMSDLAARLTDDITPARLRRLR